MDWIRFGQLLSGLNFLQLNYLNHPILTTIAATDDMLIYGVFGCPNPKNRFATHVQEILFIENNYSIEIEW